MEENEMLEQTNETENVETLTTEENEEGIELTDTSEEVEEDKETIEPEEKEEVKTFTQEEVDEIVKRRLARKERDYQRELSKYRDTENVLRTTLKLEDGDDTNAKLREFYEAEGIKLPDAIKPGLSTREIEVLAKDDADMIIKDGYDAIKEEAYRLSNIGYNNLNEREKIMFVRLSDELTNENNKRDLLKLGASEELLTDKSFNDFKKKFNSDVPITEIYDMYMKNNTKKTVKENPGSMKNNDVSKVKDYYTPEEISKLTEEDLDDPKIWEAVRKSQTKNYKGDYFN